MIPVAPPRFPPQNYLNRELCLLAFNRRVLAQAADERIPLLERLRFLSIVSSNLDEFFEIRVSGLKEQIRSQMSLATIDGKTAQETMGSWPTYRVSQSALRTMQHRLWDCYRQQRWPVPEYGSDALTALTVFLQKQAEDGEIKVPSIKR